MAERLISFDLRADFGVLKKPDVNEGLQVTFNLLHRPALLGILGAIAGLRGYEKKGEWPEYYQKLHGLKVGIQPLEPYHDKGNFTKTVITYTNTVGYANVVGKNYGANLIITEQTLRCPAYRCYLLLDLDVPLHHTLYERIKNGEAEYLPYLGKNECAAWWEAGEVGEYLFEPYEPTGSFQINSVFIRHYPVRKKKLDAEFSFDLQKWVNISSYSYFERLPIGFRSSEKMDFVQYELAEFVFSDWHLKKEAVISGLWKLESDKGTSIVQLYDGA